MSGKQESRLLLPTAPFSSARDAINDPSGGRCKAIKKGAKKVKAIRAVFWQGFVGSSGDYFLSQNDCSCCEVDAAAENERSLNNFLRLCRWLDRDTFATGIIYAAVATQKS